MNTTQTRRVNRFFLIGDYIDFHDRSQQQYRSLMQTNIKIKTFNWSSICSNHSASHSHRCPLRGEGKKIIWPTGIQKSVCSLFFERISYLTKSVCTFTKTACTFTTRKCVHYYKKVCVFLYKKCVYYLNLTTLEIRSLRCIIISWNQTNFFHRSTQCFPQSLNIRRSTRVYGCIRSVYSQYFPSPFRLHSVLTRYTRKINPDSLFTRSRYTNNRWYTIKLEKQLVRIDTRKYFFTQRMID